MADTVTLNYALQITAIEQLDTTDVPSCASAADRQFIHAEFNVTGKLTGSTTPKTEFVIIKAVTLTAGTVTIDLTAAPKSANRTQDLTGKKLVAYMLECPSANTGTSTVKPGSANPYNINGASNEIDILSGEAVSKTVVKDKATGHAAVSATVKNIDFTGTSGDIVNVLMVFD